MFRRIEIVYHRGHEIRVPFNESTWWEEQCLWVHDWQKAGLNTLGPVLDLYGVKAPNVIRTHKSVRFFFTELGWRKAGRHILTLIRKHDWQHRVIRLKEKHADVIYRDDLQVAIRTRKSG